MMTRKAWQVAQWEFIERAKKKSYIIGLIVTPLIIMAFAVLPTLLGEMVDSSSRDQVLVYDESDVLFDSLRTIVERSYRSDDGAPLITLVRVTTNGGMKDAKAEIDRRLLEDRALGALLIPAQVFDSLAIEYRGQNVSNIRMLERLERSVSDLVVERKMATAGLDAQTVRTLSKRVEIRSVRVSAEGEKETGFLQSFGLSYVLLILLLMLALTSGQLLVRSMVEEKSNRLVEVLVSSCDPMDLMFGKIIGLSALGLLQVVVWGVMAVIVVVATGIEGLPLENLGLLLLYFMLGFVFYSSIFVAFGCVVTTEQEAQQMTSYLSMFFTLPLVISFVATQVPDNVVLRVVSLIPLLTPSMMIMRIPVVAPPLWEIALTLGILVLSIIGMTWVAGKIFRVGILLTGKRPTLDEIVRWIRA
jgi:ABC-2 type transport system permease protein